MAEAVRIVEEVGREGASISGRLGSRRPRRSPFGEPSVDSRVSRMDSGIGARRRGLRRVRVVIGF